MTSGAVFNDSSIQSRPSPGFRQDPGPGRTLFLDVRFDDLSIDGALDLLLASPLDAAFRYVVTPNVDHMVRIASDAHCAGLYAGAWLCLNDSKILGRLSRIKGTPLTTVPGADLVAALLADARLERDAPLLVVGGAEGLPAELERRLGLTAVSQYRPPMGLLGDPAALEETIAAVERAGAGFVFLAIGSPQQEVLAAALRARGVARGVGLCIGASIEFLLEHRRRAPPWMRRASLEWLFRLVSEPRRMWRRYLVDGPRIFLIFASHLLGRAGPRGTLSDA